MAAYETDAAPFWTDIYYHQTTPYTFGVIARLAAARRTPERESHPLPPQSG